MGNAQPTNKTGRKVVQQKLDNATKTGVLSLSEHKLDQIPDQVYHIPTLTTLDISKNNLTSLGGGIGSLSKLKTLNCQDNQLRAGSLVPVSKLPKLQTLYCGGNNLGKAIEHPVVPGQKQLGKALPGHQKKQQQPQPEPLPAQLPPTLKQLGLDRNFLGTIPPSVVSKALTKLEKLNVSGNHLAAVPTEISNLKSLTELVLDKNLITSLPDSIGLLSKLKTLSLMDNKISVHNTNFSTTNPQPLPASLFVDTPLIDLNLHGNPMTSTQLNEFDGYHQFLERREKGKTKGIYGGALTNLDVCGLE